MTTLREAAQQALDYWEQVAWGDAVMVDKMDALRAALAEPEPRNNCAETCERAKLCATCARGIVGAEQAQPVAWRYKPMVGSPWSLSDDGYYVSCKRDNGYIVQPLYTTPPAPIVPQPLSGLDVERLLEDVVGSLPVARKLIRAVEAEVLKRMGVGK